MKDDTRHVQCGKCRKFTPESAKFCMHCGAELKQSLGKEMLKGMPEKYKDAYGTWIVTTDGDVEGRTTKHLGTFVGYVDEIALALANQAGYDLRFKKIENVNPPPKPERVPSAVHVSFDIDSKTWDMTAEGRERAMTIVFAERPVTVRTSNYYAAFKLVFPADENEG